MFYLVMNKETASHLYYVGVTPVFLPRADLTQDLGCQGKAQDFSGSFKKPRYNRKPSMRYSRQKTKKPDVQVLV